MTVSDDGNGSDERDDERSDETPFDALDRGSLSQGPSSGEYEETPPDSGSAELGGSVARSLDARETQGELLPSVVTPKPRRGLLRGAILMVVIVVFVVVGYFGISYYRDANGQAHGKESTVFVQEGSSLTALANVLAQRDIIGSSLYFRIYLKIHSAPLLQPGIYYLFQDEPYGKILNAISQGPSAVRVTTLPGETLAEISHAVGALHGHSASGFLHALTPSRFRSPFLSSGVPSLEGLLYPDTYFVDPTESDHQIAQTMLDRLSQIADSLGLVAGKTYNGLSAYQVIIGASIIEREAATAQDMPKVARVILNRLAAGMNLQMDSTVRYATNNYTQPITVTELQSSSPYNTYVHPGLPPTPISAPSAAALQAMLNPTPGTWLYFVALRGQKNESFFDTYSQQQSAIAAAGGLG